MSSYTTVDGQLRADFSHQGLTTAPVFNGNVTMIDISYNQLTDFILTFDYPLLTWVTLSHNQLTTLPDMTKAPARYHFQFICDQLVVHTGDLDHLQHCRALTMSSNQLTSVADGSLIGDVTTLVIQFNDLTSIPQLPNYGQNLQSLLLDFNSVSHLNMTEITAYPNLTHISLEGNPLHSVGSMDLWTRPRGSGDPLGLVSDLRLMHWDCSFAWTKLWPADTVYGLCPDGKELNDMTPIDLGCSGQFSFLYNETILVN